MRLHWMSKKEHDKLMEYKDSIISGWINKCNDLNKEIDNNENMIKWHESNECKLNKELCKTKGQLDKIKNMYRMLTGEEIE